MVFPKLIALYKKHGFDVWSSMSPFLWNVTLDKENPVHTYPNDKIFTYIFKDGEICSRAGGVHLSEIYFFESLAEVAPRRNIFVIGNAFGWSALALALAFPQAKVVAIDNGREPEALAHGLGLTNRIAKAEGLSVTAVKAESPTDIGAVVAAHCDGLVDLAFVDGLHTNDQQYIDFCGLRPFMASDGIFVFHDVIICHMLKSFRKIAEDLRDTHQARLLTRAASGLGVVSPLTFDDQGVIDAFIDPFVTLNVS